MSTMSRAETPEEVGFSSERLGRIPAYFQDYLDRKKVSGMSFLIARGGKVAYQHNMGVKDFDSGSPIDNNTIFRIYSMSKPITSVALMMLYEEGKFRLDHDVSRYIPEFAHLAVYDQGGINDYTTKPLDRPMQVRDLLTHTSGLTYGFMFQNTVDRLYRKGAINDAKNSKRRSGGTASCFERGGGGLPLYPGRLTRRSGRMPYSPLPCGASGRGCSWLCLRHGQHPKVLLRGSRPSDGPFRREQR